MNIEINDPVPVAFISRASIAGMHLVRVNGHIQGGVHPSTRDGFRWMWEAYCLGGSRLHDKSPLFSTKEEAARHVVENSVAQAAA